MLAHAAHAQVAPLSFEARQDRGNRPALTDPSLTRARARQELDRIARELGADLFLLE